MSRISDIYQAHSSTPFTLCVYEEIGALRLFSSQDPLPSCYFPSPRLSCPLTISLLPFTAVLFSLLKLICLICPLTPPRQLVPIWLNPNLRLSSILHQVIYAENDSIQFNLTTNVCSFSLDTMSQSTARIISAYRNRYASYIAATFKISIEAAESEADYQLATRLTSENPSKLILKESFHIRDDHWAPIPTRYLYRWACDCGWMYGESGRKGCY